MSTILKALRRLEEQKDQSVQRPLRDEVVLVPKRSGRRNGVILAMIAASAFALAGAAMVALFDRSPAEPGEAVQAVAVPVDELDVAAPPDVAITEERTIEITVAGPDPGAAFPQQVVPIAPPMPDFEVVRPAQAKQRAALAPEPDVLEVAGEEYYDDVAVAHPSDTPLPEEFAPEGIDEEVPAARAERRSAPVRVERTQWHPKHDRRVAWVEVDGSSALREVREGERVGPYVVREIEPAAVLFADGSVEVRREVGP